MPSGPIFGEIGENTAQVATATTTDASAPQLWAAAMPASSVWLIRATVTGIKSDGSAAGAYELFATVRCNASGATALVGAVQTSPTSQLDDGTWTAPAITAIANGQVQLAAGGKANTTIKWRARLEITYGG